MTKRKEILNLHTNAPNKNHTQIAKLVDCSRQYVSKILNEERPKKKVEVKDKPIIKTLKSTSEHPIEKEVVGFFTDTHIPAEHPGFLRFVKDTFDAWGVTTVVMGGDLVDHHAISRHVSETDALSPEDELKIAIDKLKAWTETFPVVKCIFGNHDVIPVRQCRELGIPRGYIKGMNQLYELPDTWEWADSWVINGVLFEHGLSSTGVVGFKNTAIAYGQSMVSGHTHANAGVLYHTRPDGSVLFGANGGCGIDVEAYNFRYGKSFKNKPTLGCVIVTSPTQAFFVHFDYEQYGK